MDLGWTVKDMLVWLRHRWQALGYVMSRVVVKGLVVKGGGGEGGVVVERLGIAEIWVPVAPYKLKPLI